MSKWSGEAVRACCTKLFCPLFRVSDIKFSKCSGEDYGNGRNRLKFGIHASVQPSDSIMLSDC